MMTNIPQFACHYCIINRQVLF